jgi:hypothetical protein
MYANLACCKALMGNYEISIDDFIEAKVITETEEDCISITNLQILERKLI